MDPVALEGLAMRMFAAIALLLPVTPAFAGPEESAVKIVRTGPRIGFGSGTVVRTGKAGSFVLTNWHVAPDGTSKFTVHHSGRAYPAEWIAADDRTDLSLLRVNAPLPAIELAEELPPIGTELRQWGYSEGGPQKAKAGRLLAETARAVVWTPFRWVTTADTCRVDIRPEFGDSGAALVGPDGRAVAVVYCGDVADSAPGDGPVMKVLVAPETCVGPPDIRRFVAKHLGH
jgi:S1-C subfamily serine protease